MGEGIFGSFLPSPALREGEGSVSYSAVLSNECARITRDLDFKIINLVIFESFVVKCFRLRRSGITTGRVATSRPF